VTRSTRAYFRCFHLTLTEPNEDIGISGGNAARDFTLHQCFLAHDALPTNAFREAFVLKLRLNCKHVDGVHDNGKKDINLNPTAFLRGAVSPSRPDVSCPIKCLNPLQHVSMFRFSVFRSNRDSLLLITYTTCRSWFNLVGQFIGLSAPLFHPYPQVTNGQAVRQQARTQAIISVILCLRAELT
jgi:hypothetical protein